MTAAEEKSGPASKLASACWMLLDVFDVLVYNSVQVRVKQVQVGKLAPTLLGVPENLPLAHRLPAGPFRARHVGT